jgi:nickel superoxide dismutase
MNKIKAYAHCDGPCGIYDPASARVAGEAVLSMTKKNVIT